MMRASVARLSRQALKATSAMHKPKFISSPLEAFRSEMNKVAGIASSEGRLDIKEGDDMYTAQLDLPEMSKDDITITLKKGILTVQALKSNQEVEDMGREGESGHEGKEEIYHVRERSTLQKYTRAWNIPKKVTQDEINAELANGVLTITYPKHAEPVHTIPIE